ncbi:MAG: class I SAM-dependent methyltransferase [Candidatus Dojkabacteria bacterium]
MPQQTWDEFYEEHGRFYLLPHPAFKRVVKLLNEIDTKTVIDLGCGNGRHLVALAEEGFDVNGIDFSPAAVDIAQKWLKERHLPGRASIADVHDEIKTFKKDSFDAVFAVNSLNFQSSNDFIDTLREINRLLKTEGILFLVVPSHDSKKNKRHKQFYFNEDGLKVALDDMFEIIELSRDDDKNFVVIAKEKTYIETTLPK